MEQFDVLVIGSGSGMLVASAAVDQGFKVALVEQGKMGGTCINVGCVPSKMLIYPADVLATLKETEKLGVHANVDSIDFNNIMNRMHELVNHDSGIQAAAVEATPNLTWFKEQGEFISDYTMQVGVHTITAKVIFIVSGARSSCPIDKGIRKRKLPNKRHCFRTANATEKHHNRGRRLHWHGVWTLLFSDWNKNHDNPTTLPSCA